MGKADSLSRRPDWEIGVEKDNKDETLIKPEWMKVRRVEAVEIIVDKIDLLEKVRVKSERRRSNKSSGRDEESESKDVER